MGANNVKARNSPKSKSLLRLSSSLNRSHAYASSNRLSANNNCNNLMQELDIYFIRQIARSLRVSSIEFVIFTRMEKILGIRELVITNGDRFSVQLEQSRVNYNDQCLNSITIHSLQFIS